MPTIRLTLALLILAAPAWVLALPCGHDGPDPFLAVIQTPSVKPVAHQITEAKEMIVLEQSKRVALRDIRNQLHVLDQITGKMILLAPVTGSLVPVQDPLNEYLLTENPFRLWNVYSKTPARLPIHGSVKMAVKQGGTFVLATVENYHWGQTLRVYHASENGKTHLQCQSNLPANLKWVEGSAFPTALFRETSSTQRVRIHNAYLPRCSLTSVSPWSEPIPGRIGPTRYFPQSQALGTIFQQGTTHVRWETQNRCRYLDTKKSQAMFFTSKAPLLVSGRHPLQVFGIEKAKTVQIPRLSTHSLRLFDISDRRNLVFLAPFNGAFSLYNVDVDSVL